MGRKYLSLAISVFMVISPLLAQDDEQSVRAQKYLKERLKKQQQVVPETQSALERFLKKIEDQAEGATEETPDSFSGFAGFMPQIGTITSSSGISGGLTFRKPFVQFSLSHSLQGYREYDAQIGLNPPRESFFMESYSPNDPFDFASIQKEGFFAYADLRYRDFPREDFYGIGNTGFVARSDYALRETSYTGIAGYQFGRRLRVDFRYGLLHPEVGRGSDEAFPDTHDVFTADLAPGLRGEPDFNRFSTSAFLDYRDQRGNPHKGGVIAFTYIRFDDRNDNRHQFNRFTTDVRHYIPLGTKARVLAVRAFHSISDPDKNAEVPFYLMETLGDSHTLRGFPQFRFRDENVAHLSTEYRWEPAGFLQLALFYDVGKVFNQRTNFDFDDLQDTYGFGVRLLTGKSVFLRFDVGRSDEGTQFYVKFGPSF